MDTRERVLGIDPGYDRCGIAIVEQDGLRRDFLIYSTCLTPPKGPRADRLGFIIKEVQKTIQEHSPNSIALETLFFSKNKKTGLAVAEARGALLITAHQAGLFSHEYSPQEVKVAITGYGASTKNQVADMVRTLVEVRDGIKYDDEFDAIAVALTHLASRKAPG